METKIVLPRGRKENIPVLGGFVIARAEKDLAEITQVASDIDQPFLDALKGKQEIVRVMVRPSEKTGELKEVTRIMYSVMDGLKPKVDLFEIRLKRAASQLTKPISAFGLSTLRKHLNRHKTEGVLYSLELLLHEIDANTDALEAKGFTPAMRTEFSDAIKQLNDANDLQNDKLDERGELTLENKMVISDFWKGISDIMAVGRLLYKDNPVKLKEYTFVVLSKRVGGNNRPDVVVPDTNNETTGMLSVTITNKVTGEAIEGVVVSVINRDITDESDEDGEAYVDGIPVGKASISLLKAGFIDAIVNDIEIKSGETTEMDVEMEVVD
jgi:hypothetical protein